MSPLRRPQDEVKNSESTGRDPEKKRQQSIDESSEHTKKGGQIVDATGTGHLKRCLQEAVDMTGLPEEYL